MFQDPSNIFETRPAIYKLETQAKYKYYLYKKTDHSKIHLDCGVCDSMSISPLLSKRTSNICGCYFGIEFKLARKNITETSVRQGSSFEHASIFGYTNLITRKLAEWKYWALLEDAIPVQSSAAIVNCIFEHLLLLHQYSVDVFEPTEPKSTLDAPVGCNQSQNPSTSPSVIFSNAISGVLPNEEA